MAEWQYVLPVWNFNSRPSARGDGKGACDGRGTGISIHAPPRGATVARLSRRAFRHFNSRPSARGDASPRWRKKPRWKFQFTPLREGRRLLLPATRHNSLISIHAPPRGATASAKLLNSGVTFQFTPLREGRPSCTRFRSSGVLFQFTPLREGRRRIRRMAKTMNKISIHAPPRGATTTLPKRRKGRKFQFTPLREGRRYLC